MPRKSSESQNRSSSHPGSDPQDAKAVGGKGDFGVPVGDLRDREYTSANTRASDRGAAVPRSGEQAEGLRVSGAGAPDSGPGASSGGDLDPDFIGVGTGRGMAADPSEKFRPGPDDAANSGATRPPGSTDRAARPVFDESATIAIDSADVEQAADSATSPARGDDSFAAEISSGEARGEDEPAKFDESA